MKVSKAIEILDYNLKTYPHLEHEVFGVAIKLGIEALKFYQGCGDLTLFEITNLLPGESPEEEVEVDKTRL